MTSRFVAKLRTQCLHDFVLHGHKMKPLTVPEHYHRPEANALVKLWKAPRSRLRDPCKGCVVQVCNMVLEVLAYKAKKQVSPPQAATGATASNKYYGSLPALVLRA